MNTPIIISHFFDPDFVPLRDRNGRPSKRNIAPSKGLAIAARVNGFNLEVGYAVCSSSENSYARKPGRNLATERLLARDPGDYYFSMPYYEAINRIMELVMINQPQVAENMSATNSVGREFNIGILAYKSLILDELMKSFRTMEGPSDGQNVTSQTECCDSWLEKRYA